MAFPEWFFGPPVLNSPTGDWQVIQADNQAQADQLKKNGYKGPYATKAAAQAAADKQKQSANSTVFNPQLPNPLNGVAAIGDFFSRLADPHTWLRVAEVLVGAAFLVIGLNHLLGNPAGKLAGATPAGRAVKAVRL